MPILDISPVGKDIILDKDKKEIYDEHLDTRLVYTKSVPTPQSSHYILETYKITKMSQDLKTFGDIKGAVERKIKERFGLTKNHVCSLRRTVDNDTGNQTWTYQVVWNELEFDNYYKVEKRYLYNEGQYDRIPQALIEELKQEDKDKEIERDILTRYETYFNTLRSENSTEKEIRQFSSWRNGAIKPSDVKAGYPDQLKELVKARK